MSEAEQILVKYRLIMYQQIFFLMKMCKLKKELAALREDCRPGSQEIGKGVFSPPKSSTRLRMHRKRIVKYEETRIRIGKNFQATIPKWKAGYRADDRNDVLLNGNFLNKT
jgi:hypothetical protein